MAAKPGTRRKSAAPDPEIPLLTEVPAEPGVFLHWDGRRQYRASIATPRVLEPVAGLSDTQGDRSNLVIEGDNLQVMASLRAQFQNMINVVLIDPPYNLGTKDFRYSDRRFHDPDADADDAVYVTNEDGGRHTKWLNYMAPRLAALKALMAPDGLLFVHINDVELFRLGALLDEIFDEKNRIGTLIWKGATENAPTRIAVEHEYLLCYAKAVDVVPRPWKSLEDFAKQVLLQAFAALKKRRLTPNDLLKEWRAIVKQNAASLPNLDRFTMIDAKGPYRVGYHVAKPDMKGYRYDIIHPVTKKPTRQPLTGYRYPQSSMKQMIKDGVIIFGKDHKQIVQLKEYLVDYQGALKSVITDIDSRLGELTLRKLLGDKVAGTFPSVKPVELEELVLSFVARKDALVLDAFAGSGTTAHALMRLNARDGGARRFIMIEEGNGDDDYARTLLAPRLRAARKKEKVPGGFTFMKVGKRRGVNRYDGKFVIGANDRGQAICLHWNGRKGRGVTGDVLRMAFEEIGRLSLRLPMRIYGIRCDVMETEDFTFCQLPDEVLNSLLMTASA